MGAPYPCGQGSTPGLLGALSGLGSGQQLHSLQNEGSRQGNIGYSNQIDVFSRMAQAQAEVTIERMKKEGKDKTVIQELQTEVDEWLEDVN